MRMFNKKVLITLALTASLTACGRSSTSDSATSAGTASTTPAATTTVASTTTFAASGPGYDFVIGGNGSVTLPQSFVQNGKTYTQGITTDSILQVQIVSGSAGVITTTVGSSNFSATYGCISYEVTVGGQTVTTETLSVDGANNENCPGAPDNQVIDFSSQLSEGHGAMFVTISNPRYDYYCNLVEEGYIPYYMAQDYCPLHTVYSSSYGTHNVSGHMNVETN